MPQGTRDQKAAEDCRTPRAGAKLGRSKAFTTRKQKRLAQAVLDDVITRDTHVAMKGSEFLSAIRDALEK